MTIDYLYEKNSLINKNWVFRRDFKNDILEALNFCEELCLINAVNFEISLNRPEKPQQEEDEGEQQEEKDEVGSFNTVLIVGPSF